jgi:PleD family two-component response regulator
MIAGHFRPSKIPAAQQHGASFISRMKPKPTVLFIDDDATTRKVHTAGMAMAGIPTHIVGSAEDAAKILEDKKVDVIVTDLMMPNFDGVDLIQAVRSHDHTKHLPIIVFTSGGNQELVEKAALAGANEILQKHTTPPAKLIEKILKLHEESKTQT